MEFKHDYIQSQNYIEGRHAKNFSYESESASQKMGCALETKLVTLYTASIWHASSRPFWLLSIDLYQWNCEIAFSNLGEVFLMGAQISAPLL